MNLYDILEIKQSATKLDIKKAYIRLAKIYHPDKNPNTEEKFKQIQAAYEVLSNDETRVNYQRLDKSDRNTFISLFNKIISNSLDLADFVEYGININIIDFEYIKDNFNNFFKNLNIKELFELFINGKLNKKQYNEPINCSDTDDNVFNEIMAEYFYELPLSNKTSPLDINISLGIKLGDIKSNKRKITIKRRMEDEELLSTFVFTLNKQHIIFYGGGDCDDGEYGNLHIKLNLPSNYLWNETSIIIEQPMTLYEMIYGLDMMIDSYQDMEINIPGWVPSRDGLLIELTKYQNAYKLDNYNIVIRLYLNYETSVEKEILLRKYFS